MKRILPLLACLLAGVIGARAELHTEAVEYKQGDATLEGYLAYDASQTGKRPGVLIVHQWKGLGDYEKKRAAMLAQMGYVVFCADIYGKGIRPTAMADAGAQAGKYKGNRPLLRARVNAALDVLKQNPLTDTQHVAAMGYCFGGTTVLELARSGADVQGVISFHGGLNTPTPADAKNIKGKVLALHGADDPNVPPAEVTAFEDEMRKAGVDWQLVAYGNTVHSFTDWNAGNDNSKGAAYNEKSDKRSWAELQRFLGEVFAK